MRTTSLKSVPTLYLSILLCGVAIANSPGLALKITTAQEPVTVTVSGCITDRKTGTPISKARVRGHIHTNDDFERCSTAETYTDDAGTYTLLFTVPLSPSVILTGIYSSCVYADAVGYGCQPHYFKSKLTPDDRDILDIDLALVPGARLHGAVISQETGPVANARVRIQNGMNGDWNFFGSLGDTFTNEEGEFELWIDKSRRSVLGKNPWLCIQKQGEGVSMVWDIKTAEDLGRIVLHPGGTVSGRILDNQGLPLPDCEVSVRTWPCDLIDQTLTDAEGHYTLSGIPSLATIQAFYQRKNGSVSAGRGKVTVFARLDPDTLLRNSAQYQIPVIDGETLFGPDLTVGRNYLTTGHITGKVTGRVSGDVLYGLGGLKIRLDNSWNQMVETNLEGYFGFPDVAPGPHRLTAYLPHNLRYDRGIGRTEIFVPADHPLEDVVIELENLAQMRVQFLDSNGNPLPGVTAGAAWSKSGGGGWTEGMASDTQGWALLYLYPNSKQYVRGYMNPGGLVTEIPLAVEPDPGQVFDPKLISMVLPTSLTGQLLRDSGAPLAQMRIQCHLSYADGQAGRFTTLTDDVGQFQVDRVTPGVFSLDLETEEHLFLDVLSARLEAVPGETIHLGSLKLTDAMTTQARVEKVFDEVVAKPRRLYAEAEKLLQDIRAADYDNVKRWKQDRDAWKDFIKAEYCVYTNYPGWVKWICEHFQDNPITKVTWGEVSRSTQKGFWKGHKRVPAVEYSFTLKDNSTLTGTLLFDYHPGKDLWMGLHGLDWHLQE